MSCSTHPLEFHSPGWHGDARTPVVDGKYYDRATGKLSSIRDDDHPGEAKETGFLAAVGFDKGESAARIELIQYLVARGADPQATVQQQLVSDHNFEYVDSDRALITLLVKELYVSIRRQLFNDQAFLTSLGVSALHHNLVGPKAFFFGYLSRGDTLRLVGDYGQVPYTSPPEGEEIDAGPIIPLHAALMGTYHGNKSWKHRDSMDNVIQLVKVLTANPRIREATINASYRNNFGNSHTSLHMATRFDHVPLLLTLIELGADITVPRPGGIGSILALFLSVVRENCGLRFGDTMSSQEFDIDADARTDMMAVFKALVSNKDSIRVAVNEADAYGNTPLHLAMGLKMKSSVAALLALGARAAAEQD
ncbi:hypothetical protein SEUCBS139899_005844 [Sporothrix eucalyptigena]|uniref:Ankyrin repeat protein n=1 Tax=Sporothrix eucalyptigena TaxID=1812306 RepID=A0ABP0C9S6_9PEZI